MAVYASLYSAVAAASMEVYASVVAVAFNKETFEFMLPLESCKHLITVP